MNTFYNADAHTLRAVLFAICDKTYLRDKALQHLDALKSTGGPSHAVSICAQCKETYRKGENTETACLYHEGEMEVDEEAFVDHDERCHGPMDTPENRDEYPENFIWSCCDARGDEEGCTQGRHVDNPDNAM